MKYKPIRLLLWGAGKTFRDTLPELRKKEKAGQIKVVGVTDRYPPEGNTVEGYPYIPPQAVTQQLFDYLVTMVGSYQIRKEINALYLKMPGSDPDKLINQLFPEIDIFQYLRLKEAAPTIFSRNCWGGYVYSNLGLECRSPFKNLWLYDDEFLRFLSEPRAYMAEDLEPDHMQEGMTPWDNARYPVLRLGDIHIHCNHSDSMEQAIADWNRRREKINWDFTVGVMQTYQPLLEQKFNRLETLHRKLCFVPYPTEQPYSLRIPPREDPGDIARWENECIDSSFPYQNPFDMYSLFFGELKKNPRYAPYWEK